MVVFIVIIIMIIIIVVVIIIYAQFVLIYLIIHFVVIRAAVGSSVDQKPSGSGSTTSGANVQVDQSLPVTNIQIRLPDGSRCDDDLLVVMVVTAIMITG